MSILIGLDQIQKCSEIAAYVERQKIAKVYVFYPEAFPLDYPDCKAVEYKEIIMYRTFYPLLEEIDSDSLLVFNECLRTRNRSDLTYNCAHHYCNQTPHKIVFEYFPFIEDKNDFMILLDLLDKGRYKGKSFDWRFLQEQDIRGARHAFSRESIDVEVGEAVRSRYAEKKN